MRYIMRISGMIVGVLLGSAVLASFLSQYVALANLDAGAVFVGLATMGFMVAILTREAWLAA